MAPLTNCVLAFLFLVGNVCCQTCRLNDVKLDRPGYAGKLQMCLGNRNGRQSWKLFCSDNEDSVNDIADLACRYHLNHSLGGEQIYFYGEHRNTITINCNMQVMSLQSCRMEEYRDDELNSNSCNTVLGVICNNSSYLPIANRPITTPVITPTSSCHQQLIVVSTSVNSGCSISSDPFLNSSRSKDVHNYTIQNSSRDNTCTPQNSLPNTGSHNGTILGGALGGVLGVLVVIVVIGLCIGLLYYRNIAYSYRITVEKTTNSRLDNPVYAAPPPPTSVNHQQITTQSQDHSEMNGNHYQIDDDQDYHVLEDSDCHVLGNSAQSKQHVPVINYEGFREDSVSVQSYEVPVSQSQENDRK